MPQPSFSEIASLPDFQSLPFEKKAEVTKKYWQTSAAEDPQPAPEAPKSDLLLEPGQEQAVAPPSYHQEQYQDSLKYLDAQEKLKNATPIQARFLNQQLEDSAAALAVRESLKSGAMTEEEAAAFAEENVKARAGETEALAKTRRLFDPEIAKELQPRFQELEKTAREGGVFSSVPVSSLLDPRNIVDKIIPPHSPESEGSIVKGRRQYGQLREQFAEDFGLSSEEADDYLKHKFNLQTAPVSQDVFGQTHFKDDLLAKGLPEVEKAVAASNLPNKEALAAELPQRLTAFKASTVENVKKNHPEFAANLKLTGDVEHDFKLIQDDLNQGAASQAAGGAGAGALRTAEDISTVTRGGQLTTASGIPYSPTGHSGEETQAMIERARANTESRNQISAQLNADKTKLLGTDAASIGGGLYSAAESVAIGAATAGLGELIVPAAQLAKLGKAGVAVGKFATGAANVAPVAGLYGTRQAVDTYDEAIKLGKTPEEAQELAIKSGLIEMGVTMAFSGAGHGGLEDLGAKLGSEVEKKTFGSVVHKVLEGTAHENLEEGSINLFNTLAVQTKLHPEMTIDDLKKSAYDTLISTTLSTGPLALGTELSRKPAQPTHEQSTSELSATADALYTKAALNAEKDLSETKDQGGTVTPPSDAGVVKPQMTTAEVLASAKENAATEADPEHKALLESGDATKIAESYGVEINDEQDQKEKPEEASLPLREVPTGTETSTNTESTGSNEEVAGTAKAEGEVEVTPTVTISEPNAQGLVRAKTDNVEADFKPTDDPKVVELDLIRRKDRKSASDQGTRKGEGQEVLKAAEEHFAAQGVEKIVAQADNNPDLLAWYERNGYTRGTLNKSNNTVNISKDLTAPVVSPATETATAPATETTPALTQEAADLLAKVDGGAVPLGVTPNFERIATENGIEVTGSTTPQQVIDQLREKQSAQPTAATPTAPEGTTSAPETAPTASEAAPAPTTAPATAPTAETAPEAPAPPQRKLPPRPAKPAPSPSETSTRNEVTDQILKDSGLSPVAKPAQEALGETWDQAQAVVNTDPDKGTDGSVGRRLVQELIDHPRALRNAVEEGILLDELAQRKVRLAKAQKDSLAATTDEARADAAARFKAAQIDVQNVIQASQLAGTEWGRVGRFRQISINEDYSIEAMQARYTIEINKGEALTKEQAAEVKALQKELDETTKKLEEKTSETAELTRELEAAEHLAHLAKSAETSKEHGTTSRDAKRAAVKARLERAQKRLKAKSGNVNAGLDPTTLADTVAVVYNYLELGLRSLPEIKAKIVETYGKWIGKHVDKAYEEATKLFDEVEAESKEATPKSVYKMANELINSGLRGMAVLEKVQEAFPSKTLSEIQDLFLNESKKSNNTKTALQEERARLRRMVNLTKQIEQLKKGPIPKNPKTKAAKDTEIEVLTMERDSLAKALRVVPVKSRIKTLENQVLKLEAAVAAGVAKQAKAKTQGPDTADVADLKARRDAANKELRNLKSLADKDLPLIAAANKRTAEINDKIRRNDFTKDVKIPRAKSNQFLAAQLRQNEAKEKWERLFFEQQLKDRAAGQKVWDGVGEFISLGRTTMTMGDWSAVLIQGGFDFFGHPIQGTRRLADMFKATFSAQHELAIQNNIKAHPLYTQSQRDKLFLSEHNELGSQAKFEEQMRGRWAEKIPGLGIVKRASDRAFSSYLNMSRMNRYASMVEKLTKTGKATSTEGKAIANFVNTSHGRGNLESHEAAAKTLAMLFFSPKYVLSRFQLILGAIPVVGHTATGYAFASKDVKRAQKAIAVEYARTIAGMAAFYSMLVLGKAAFADDDDDLKDVVNSTMEFDPRSSNFLKLQYGKRTLDFSAGLGPQLTFISRMIPTMHNGKWSTYTKSGQNVVSTHNVKFGKTSYAGVLARYLWGKTSPALSSAINLGTGENVVGKKVTPESSLISMYTPLPVSTAYEHMMGSPVDGLPFAAASLFGGNASQRDDKAADWSRDIAILLGSDPAKYKKKSSGGPAFKVRH